MSRRGTDRDRDRGRGGSRSRFGSNRWWDNKEGDGSGGGGGAVAEGTFYSILNVESTANTDEIKAAYRKLALKYHPDMRQASESESGNGSDEAAAEEARREAEIAMENQAGELDYGRASAQLAEAVAQLAAIKKMRGRS